MANELKSRIQLKHDTEENWLKATNFIPKEGEIVIYDVDANNPIARFKIGDGTTSVNQLSFVSHHKIISYLPQVLSEEEMAQARENIGAMSEEEVLDILGNIVYINVEDNENIEDPEIPAITVDDTLSETSINPVQNNVITAELNRKVTSGDLTDAINAIPNASTSIYGLTKLSTSTSGTSEVLAATESAVKLAYDKGANAETVANAALPKSGGSMTGAITAQNNNNYDTKQVRNIFLVAEGEDLPSGSNGDICLIYVP